MQEPVRLALIGAGNRGRGIFGQYALDMPHNAKFVSVVEPNPEKRQMFAEAHGISSDLCFSDYESFFASENKLADAVVIATLEDERLRPIQLALEAGYHILVEKPLGCTPAEVIEITDAAAKNDNVFIVCHQLRHTPVYSAIKNLMAKGELGDLIAIEHSENLSYEHMAHSFVRGSFNNDAMTPMILAKSCHDMDIMRYFADSKPKRISSFGGLTYFTKKNAPAGAPKYCLDGCPAHRTCPYNVLNIYFRDDTDPAYLRNIGVSGDRSQLMEVLKHSQFGRCVFRCDNNVVDHQSVIIEFCNGVTASFSMIGHNYLERRITKLSFTNGEIEFDWSRGDVFTVYTFMPRRETQHHVNGNDGTHGGGDRAIMDAFVDAIRTGDRSSLVTPVEMSLDSHLMSFAAEEARLTGNVVVLEEYEFRNRHHL